MRTAWFDCFSGISGDMTLGALLSCGADEAHLRTELAKLKVTGWEMKVEATSQNGIGATDVTVNLTEPQGHGRHLHHIEETLQESDISPAIRANALSVFSRLAQAEAKIHQTTVDRIHFHEVGAVDAIVDIVGACVALESLGVEQVVCSPFPMSRGFVECMHGSIPLPAPAVLELLKDVPVYGIDVEGEMVTPTGAALATTLATRFGAMPAMSIVASGYGAGKSKFGNRPNLLRIVIGDTVEDSFSGASEVVEILTNLDDFSPQFYEPLSEALFAGGAVDVFLSPIQMKKNRPGTLLTVLAPPERAESLAEVIFRNTTTLGVRMHRLRRLCIEREWVTVETEFGSIRIKVGHWKGAETTASPEFEDVRRAAEAHGVPVKAVHEVAVRAYRSVH